MVDHKLTIHSRLTLPTAADRSFPKLNIGLNHSHTATVSTVHLASPNSFLWLLIFSACCHVVTFVTLSWGLSGSGGASSLLRSVYGTAWGLGQLLSRKNTRGFLSWVWTKVYWQKQCLIWSLETSRSLPWPIRGEFTNTGIVGAYGRWSPWKGARATQGWRTNQWTSLDDVAASLWGIHCLDQCIPRCNYALRC
jgi:hypothetical protein